MNSLKVDNKLRECICNFPKMHGSINNILDNVIKFKEFDARIENDIKYMLDLCNLINKNHDDEKLNMIFVNYQVLITKMIFYLLSILRMTARK